MGSNRARLAAVTSAVLGVSALWRAGLAVRHYRISLKVVDDPSVRELEQVSAFFELGLCVVFLGHSVAAAYLIRHPLRLHGVVVLAVAVVTGVLIAGSFLQTPILRTLGLLPATLILGCAGVGFFLRAPWASAYLGAVAGSVAGFGLAAPNFEPLASLAVTVPPAVFALLGVALGRLFHRLSPHRRAASQGASNSSGQNR